MSGPTMTARMRWRLACALWAVCDQLDAVRAFALADRLDLVAQRMAPRRLGVRR